MQRFYGKKSGGMRAISKRKEGIIFRPGHLLGDLDPEETHCRIFISCKWDGLSQPSSIAS